MKLTIKSVLPVSLAFLGILFIVAWFCEEIFRAILSDEGMRLLFQEYAWDIAALVIGSLFLLGFSVAWVVYWFIVRPLERLNRGVQKMSEGNFEEKIEWNAPDEIGELAGTLEKIRLILKSSAGEVFLSHNQSSLVDAKNNEEKASSL